MKFLILSLYLFTVAPFAVFAETTRPATTQAPPPPPTASARPEALPRYTVGTGNKYNLTMGKDVSEVTIAFVESTAEKLVVEIYMESKTDSAKLGIKMWQQFHLGLVNGKVAILKGVMKIPQLSKPQILPSEYMQGYNGVQMKSFLIGSAAEMTGKKIGVEKVSAGGRSFECTHFRQGENSQTVDYWVSDEAKPLGLVKLDSTGRGTGQAYNMIYTGPAKDVTSHIDMKDAEPLNDMAKAFLPMLGPAMFSF